jgi:ribose transport system permease protein
VNVVNALPGELSRYSRDAVAPTCLLAAVVAFAVLAPNSLAPDNARNVAAQVAPLAIVALGQMVVVVTGGFDLSVGSVAALAAVVAASAANEIGPMALWAAPLVGLACGLANGAVVGRLGVQPIIATLGMLLFARGFALFLSDGQAVVLTGGNPIAALGYGYVLGLPVSFALALGLVLCAALLLRRTRAGRRIYMVGSNGEGARLVGVNVERTLLLAYAVSGLAAGLAALLFVGRAGAGLPTEGTGLELAAIAAAVIGGTALTGGVGRPVSVLLGALFIQTLANGLNLLGTSPFVQEIVLGSTLILAGLTDHVIRRLAARGRTQGGLTS